jgi:16S rRNA (uracil1498-N3)-methyltransferase
VKQLVIPPGCRTEESVVLQGKEHHYLARVRRIAVGERVMALDQGEKLQLEVTAVTKDATRLKVVDKSVSYRQGPRIVLFPFLLKSGKLDDVIRQACEASVSAVIPVFGDHCIARPDRDDAKKVERWTAIAREAAQQSGSADVCEIHSPVASREVAVRWQNAGPLLFFHQVPLDKGSLHRYLFPRPETVGLVVGPEGGLSQAEVDALRAQGALPVWLGPFVLRAETASLYAVAAVNTILQETQEWTIPQ